MANPHVQNTAMNIHEPLRQLELRPDPSRVISDLRTPAALCRSVPRCGLRGDDRSCGTNGATSSNVGNHKRRLNCVLSVVRHIKEATWDFVLPRTTGGPQVHSVSPQHTASGDDYVNHERQTCPHSVEAAVSKAEALSQ